MTPEQETEVLASLKTTKELLASLQPIVAEVPGLKAAIAARDTQIADLQKGHLTLSQEGERNSLKTAYPDVPVDVLLSIPADKRAEQGKLLQEQFTKVKATIPVAQTDPLAAWARTGGIGPTSEAEKAAMQREAEKSYDDAKNKGDVGTMLGLRMGELVAHARRALTPQR